MDHARDNSVSSGSVSPKPLVMNHVTSNSTVVDVFQTDYSECFRSYCVYRRDPFLKNAPACLRILSVNDMMLLAVLFALAVPSFPPFMEGLRGVHWTSSPASNIGRIRSSVSDSNRNDTAFLDYPWTPGVPMTRLILCILCCVVTVCRVVAGVCRAHTEEVTAIRGLGMQITSYNVFGWVLSQRFVDLRLIRSLVVHDAFFRCQAIFFLSATVENEATRLVLFEETLPRLAVLRPVLCGLRHILFEEPETGATLTEMEGQGPDRLDVAVDRDLKDVENDSNVTEREHVEFLSTAESPRSNGSFS